MQIVGLMPVRNESWVCGLTIRAALMWVDKLVILLHDCEDETISIVESIIRENDRGRIIVIHEGNPEWAEMPQREMMLEAARRNGATHLAVADVDELISGNLLPLMRQHVEELQLGQLLQTPLYNVRGSLTRYHANGVWGNRWVSVAFRDAPSISWAAHGDTFHRREPIGSGWRDPHKPIDQGQGGVLHLWGLSERMLIAKHRAYRISERLRWPYRPAVLIERLYSLSTHGDPNNPVFGTPETWTYATTPASWWSEYERRGWMKHLDINAVPWQEKWADEMIAKYGREKFAGLSV